MNRNLKRKTHLGYCLSYDSSLSQYVVPFFFTQFFQLINIVIDIFKSFPAVITPFCIQLVIVIIFEILERWDVISAYLIIIRFAGTQGDVERLQESLGRELCGVIETTDTILLVE